MAILGELGTEILIPVCGVIGIVFAVAQWFIFSKVKVTPSTASAAAGAKNGYGDYLIEEEEEGLNDHNVVIKCAEIQTAICEGLAAVYALGYLSRHQDNNIESLRRTEQLAFFWAAFLLIHLGGQDTITAFAMEDNDLWLRHLLNLLTQIALALYEEVKLLGTWLQGDRALTFCHILARNTIRAKPAQLAFGTQSGPSQPNSPSGYGLGGSSMALFGRVGGGIYTKAADVGADLVGKVERNIPEDDPRNPAVISDNVDGNVGDIAGMGSDLFGSYAKSSCAALVVASISSFGINHDFTAMCYPLLVSSAGIIVCLLTTLFATDFFEIKAANEIEPALKKQLIISTALMTVGVAVISWLALPAKFTIFKFGAQKEVSNWGLFFCVAVGLWDGLIIGFVTEYYTSNAYSPVQDVADSCRTGAATNVIFGLALGYKCVIIPIFAIAVSIYVSLSIAAMYDIAMASLGMLSTMATGLAIDAYGPISDNAGGIAEMAGMSHRIHERTDALDAAGATFARWMAVERNSSRTSICCSTASDEYHHPALADGVRAPDPEGSVPNSTTHATTMSCPSRRRHTAPQERTPALDALRTPPRGSTCPAAAQHASPSPSHDRLSRANHVA
ncbi:pyrophosphate-energized vacuolar membrane proton pump-like [Hordeum vulgare subsp. vulgare]|uniref:pyrophosphate-energized vacuolar membrane proton pump-like n=1 Tax=Hordeum vulgare subsp. vulgare TaxID=112509 RepID=UPI001D1A5A6D|nr:pyrophosphate-energized vacuolar membrane proton pump-like [Hordeum vulgare subsp. vulgare]